MPPLTTTTISPDDLIALTDEMASLVKAGVPLEKSLASTAADLANNPSVLAGEMGERLAQGESLVDVINSSPHLFSPTYAAVVETGARSGRLAVALEQLADVTRRDAQLQRDLRFALVYPLLVSLLTLAAGAGMLAFLQPRIASVREVFRFPSNRFDQAFVWLGETAIVWAPLAALGILYLAYRYWRATTFDGRAASSSMWTMLLGSLRQWRHAGRWSMFAELLALLVEQGAPLGKALTLAANATADPELQASAKQLAEAAESGGLPRHEAAAADASALAMPPMLYWLISRASTQQQFVHSLRRLARVYRSRAELYVETLRLFVPTLLIAIVGGTLVLVYAMAVLAPWLLLLQEFTRVSLPR